MNTTKEKQHGWSWWYLLFIIQFIAVRWPPYNRVAPGWMGVPYFYWYQMLWVLISALLTGIVYFATRR